MAKVIKKAETSKGLLKIIEEKNNLDFSTFENIPYDPNEFGGKYIKEAREQQTREGRDIEDSPIIYKGEK